MDSAGHSLRLLFVSSYYPPCKYGWGYMQLCEEVADRLSKRGHQISILTSKYGNPREVRDYPVHRVLDLDPDWQTRVPIAIQFFIGRSRRQVRASENLFKVINEFCPDAIFVWQTNGLPRKLLRGAEGSGCQVVYYVADYEILSKDSYLVYWQGPAVKSFARPLKRILAKVAERKLKHEGDLSNPKFEKLICVSNYVRECLSSAGLGQERVVAHNGVNIANFTPEKDKQEFPMTGPLKCLISGRISPEKGIHTAIEAFAAVSRDSSLPVKASLTIMGDGPTDYKRHLIAMVKAHGAGECITFLPPVSRDQIARVLAAFDLLILPSEWGEPLARSMQEAMAMGLLVIGTATGGSCELLKHDRTGLVFQAGNPQSLAEQLRHAMSNPDRARQLAGQGQRLVRTDFRIDQTVEKIEAYLNELVGEVR